ncbi:MAG: hypothetical protein GTN68_25665 [Candidatus Aminicenantes bacterium]|nr:hypothetical protein [Candidatus Aminicenantes bacterium]NIQ69919.1 hypothetical protein [Candidatus Aminicenantes bacterium]
MEFVDHDEKFKVKQSERQVLKLLDRNTKPTPDFIKLLAAKVQQLAIQGKIRGQPK